MQSRFLTPSSFRTSRCLETKVVSLFLADHGNFTLIILVEQPYFFKPIFVFLEGPKNQDSIVYKLISLIFFYHKYALEANFNLDYDWLTE